MNLAAFKELIKQRCGLIFESVGEALLVNGLHKRITETGSKSALTYYNKLQGDDGEFHELVCLLTINETYFYREPEQLQLLVDCLIPRILSRKQDRAPVRILSAGCSTGEEPYSIAMALCEKYGESAARLFQLEGGDIDKDVLNKARVARYTDFSFRSLSAELRDRYFDRHGKWEWNVKAELRRQVHFQHLNLLDENYHHALQDYDIIFFRNVSIYFDVPTRRLIQQHLASLLRNDGLLIIGTAETLANDLGVLKLQEEGGMFYFAKLPVLPVNQPLAIAAFPTGHKAVTDWILPSPVFSLPLATQAVRLSQAQAICPAPTRLLVAANIKDALQLTREKHYDDALALIVRLLEQKPDASDALLLKAHILLHRKDYAAAELSAQQALNIEPWSTDAFVLLGLAAKWRKDAESAVKWFKQAVYARNECWPAHYYLGELYRAGNEIDKARRAYRVVLQLLSTQQAPNDGLSIIPLGLPASEVQFLCEHQAAKLDSQRAAVSG